MEEDDYLKGAGGCRDFTERAEAEREERPRPASMFLDRDGTKPRRRDAGLDAERHGQGEHGQQGRELSWIGDMRLLQIEALGFQVRKKRFDGPPLAIAGQRMARLAGTRQREKLPRLQAHHDDPHGR